MAGKIVETAKEIIEPILQELDLELFDLKYVKEGKTWFLRVFIDSPSGIDLDTCTRVSERLSEALDEKDFIDDAYYLEVSSPGAERPLRGLEDFKKAIGKDVRITTYEAIDGHKEFEGHLLDVTDDFVTVAMKEKTKRYEVQVPIEKIANATLAIIF
ncbi:ribosome maturation factor RimP [Pullulanibacillus pueri]|uniref:Ribosome maturation factor RimP n=1 Tax=Pullulanibacillus pueri TaxID=1437324 RepID=A0A8J2ZVQ4_9BACL|nr:ribosome maturation factor RimP [Pullulanibacillus pueri]MBM7682514.1 ribosome maturation factor RimP [Pullulanibacillus pueri]GGH82095.1 ribosome maturation factor RimP [Pullulanibacillus pueri]